MSSWFIAPCNALKLGCILMQYVGFNCKLKWIQLNEIKKKSTISRMLRRKTTFSSSAKFYHFEKLISIEIYFSHWISISSKTQYTFVNEIMFKTRLSDNHLSFSGLNFFCCNMKIPNILYFFCNKDEITFMKYSPRQITINKNIFSCYFSRTIARTKRNCNLFVGQMYLTTTFLAV